MKTDFSLLIGGFLFLLSCSSKQSANTCDSFKKGKFIINSRFDSATTLIERYDSVQIETNKKTGSIVSVKIHWIGPCEYELLYHSGNSKDNIDSFLKVNPVKVKIKTITANYYIFEATTDGVPLSYIDTLWRINE